MVNIQNIKSSINSPSILFDDITSKTFLASQISLVIASSLLSGAAFSSTLLDRAKAAQQAPACSRPNVLCKAVNPPAPVPAPAPAPAPAQMPFANYLQYPTQLSVGAKPGHSVSVGMNVVPILGFKGQVTVQMGKAPAWLSVKPVSTYVASRTVVPFTLTAAAHAPMGTHAFSMSVNSGNKKHAVNMNFQVLKDGSLKYLMEGAIHQTAYLEANKQPIPAIVIAPASLENGWKTFAWRWADTMHHRMLTVVPDGPGGKGKPAYQFKLTQADTSSPGTSGRRPRAEFFSITGAEDKVVRLNEPPLENVVREGDEYWATFSVYLPTTFPKNHRYITLFQRKFQNVAQTEWDRGNAPQMATLNIHREVLDITPPGPQLDQNAKNYKLADLKNIVGKWVQFTIHEKASMHADRGLFEVYMKPRDNNGSAELMNNLGQPVYSMRGATLRDPKYLTAEQRTNPGGVVNYNFHYGLYRDNDRHPDNKDPKDIPGDAQAFYTPMLILRGQNQQSSAPVLP